KGVLVAHILGRDTLRPMGAVTSNFQFLEAHDVRLASLGALAERCFADDPPAALIKLRQLAELLAKDIAASHALLPSTEVSSDDAPRTLRSKAILPREGAAIRLTPIRAANGQRYPAKAIVGIAVGKLPGEAPLRASEYFGGFGESQSYARLRELGYTIVGREEAGMADGELTR